MERTDNYARQALQAKQLFLRYDQQQLIRKLHLEADAEYLYANLLCKPYRIHRTTGDVQRLDGDLWVDANSHSQVMTLLDLVCDSKPDRYVCGRWKQMSSFGLMFHQNMLEHDRDPWAQRFQENPDALRSACKALGGREMPGGDVSFVFEVFDGLPLWLQFWLGDEEFAPQLRFLWDENALMYLKYETMYFAVPLLLRQIAEAMEP